MSGSRAAQQAPRRTWAEDRLRLGQANVGFWVVTAGLALLLRPAVPIDLAPGLAWVAVVTAYVVLQAPFDLLGGYLLPVRHERRPPGVAPWAWAWVRGVAVHGGVAVGLGWLALAAGAAGPWAAVGVLVLAGGLLVALQGLLVRLSVGRAIARPEGAVAETLADAGLEPDAVQIVDVDDPSFVGGWVGPRGLERLVLPRRWTHLGADALEVLAVRRRLALRSGARAQGVMGALMFNAVGLVATVGVVPGAGFDSVGALVLTSAGVTLWSFLGLLTLPTASRLAVYRLDRWTAEALGDPDRVARVVARLDRDQEDEVDRTPWIETIFHPVPAPAHRVASLQAPAMAPAPLVPWRIARMALFTSWASFSCLPRAVHCNVGRPELWALPPGD